MCTDILRNEKRFPVGKEFFSYTERYEYNLAVVTRLVWLPGIRVVSFGSECALVYSESGLIQCAEDFDVHT